MVLDLALIDVIKIYLRVVVHGETGLLLTGRSRSRWLEDMHLDQPRFLFGEQSFHRSLGDLFLLLLVTFLLIFGIFLMIFVLKFVFLLWLLKNPLRIRLEKLIIVDGLRIRFGNSSLVGIRIGAWVLFAVASAVELFLLNLLVVGLGGVIRFEHLLWILKVLNRAALLHDFHRSLVDVDLASCCCSSFGRSLPLLRSAFDNHYVGNITVFS